MRGSPGKASAGNAVSASPEALHGRPRQEARSPYRARPLARGLGKEPDLRLARGLILRLTRGLILHVARGWLAYSPSPPASTDPPDSASCLNNASTTPTISAGRRLNATEWPTRPEVASAPYRPGQGTAGITGHCVLTLCPRSAPYRLGQGTAGITGHCVLTLYPRSATHSRPRHCTPRSRLSWGSCLPRPLHHGAASTPTKSRPRAQSVHSGLHVRRTYSEAVPGLPRRTGSDGTATPPQCSKDGPLRRPHHHRNRLQGPDTPPLFTRRHIVSSCTVLTPPFML